MRDSYTKWFIVVLPFLALWYYVFDSCRLEWSTNPQYSYGWIVPIFSLFLAYKNWQSADAATEPASPKLSRLLIGSLAIAFALILPARLIAASTPEWRPLQWAFALIATGASLLLIRAVLGRNGLDTFGYPVAFMLIAIPWPTPIEQPIIQSLTQADAATVVEIMGAMGIPTVQHGNLLEIASGVVGIDEACSGIRSFQSSLMISLFLGGYYRFPWTRKLLLLVCSVIISFLFNVARTTFLTWIASKDGVQAIARYHDPAGLTILVVCTLTLWVLALMLCRKRPGATAAAPTAPRKVDATSLTGSFKINPGLMSLSIVLIAWLAVVEGGTRVWYARMETRMPAGPDWSMTFPTNAPGFKSFSISQDTYNLLRYDEAIEGEWSPSQGTSLHAYYFEWNKGRVSGYLAKRHTPEICMGAIGQELKSGPTLFFATVQGIKLPIRQYVFETHSAGLHVFHCRWEAGASVEESALHESGRFNLIRSVWTGRGNKGQKVFEVIMTGYETPEDARAVLLAQLQGLVHPGPAKIKQSP